MDWIKKRYDQFLLALFAILLLAFSVMLILRSQSFAEKFADAKTTIPENKKIDPLVLDRIEEAKAALEKPAAWVIDTKEDPDRTRGSLFVSDYYIIGKDTGVPEKPAGGSLYTDSLTSKPIPNKWFMTNGLPLLTADVALQDPDMDGFTNEDEWRGSTDPNNQDSHPAYHTKLFLKQFIQVPFRLKFNAYDGDPKKVTPDKMTFQVDTIDLRQPTEFLKLGDMVPKTKYKLEKFDFKEVMNPKTEAMQDVSELTVVNTETGDAVVLTLAKVTNSPNNFALFDYQWPPPMDIQVQRIQEFVLKPETDKRYKLIDTNQNEAVIQLPSGEKYTVGRDPRKAPK